MNSVCSTPTEDGVNSTVYSGTQNGAGNSDNATMTSMLSFVSYRPGTLADNVTDGYTVIETIEMAPSMPEEITKIDEATHIPRSIHIEIVHRTCNIK